MIGRRRLPGHLPAELPLPAVTTLSGSANTFRRSGGFSGTGGNRVEAAAATYELRLAGLDNFIPSDSWMANFNSSSFSSLS
jgi:hypothetical protein